MKIKDLKKEELDLMSYDDLAYMVLVEAKKKMKINDLFKEVCNILKLDDNIFETKIADFFELLSMDKKFIMLENGYWDLREKHTPKIKIETDDDDVVVDTIEKNDDELEEEKSTDLFYEVDETEDEVDDELNDLVIVDEEEE